jgi:hypothetical protein
VFPQPKSVRIKDFSQPCKAAIATTLFQDKIEQMKS